MGNDNNGEETLTGFIRRTSSPVGQDGDTQVTRRLRKGYVDKASAAGAIRGEETMRYLKQEFTARIESLHRTVKSGDMTALREILRDTMIGEFINSPLPSDTEENSPLRVALTSEPKNQVAVVDALLKAGANPDILRERETLRQLMKNNENVNAVQTKIERAQRNAERVLGQ